MVTFEHDDTAESFAPSEPAPEQANDHAPETTPEPETKAAETKPIEFKVSDKVTYRETPAVITYKNADGTFDVQMVDEKTGEALRDISDQPRWTPNVEAKELLHRS